MSDKVKWNINAAAENIIESTISSEPDSLEAVRERVRAELKQKAKEAARIAYTTTITHSTNTYNANTSAQYSDGSGNYDAKAKPMAMSFQQTPAQRRRSLGDECKTVDVPGFWVNIRFNRESEPSKVILFEVNTDMSMFRYIGDDVDIEWRAIERLTKQGIFIYIF